MNMGTPRQAEGVPHWSNKAMYAHKLEGHRKRQRGFWLFFKEYCGRCKGGGFVENILSGVTSVRSEADYDGFRPDILLERGEESPIWLEITHTSPPSASKLAYCTDRGIDVFELEGGERPVDSAVRKAHISHRNCRQRLRQRLFDLWQLIASLDDPLVGIKEDFRSPERQRREDGGNLGGIRRTAPRCRRWRVMLRPVRQTVHQPRRRLSAVVHPDPSARRQLQGESPILRRV